MHKFNAQNVMYALIGLLLVMTCVPVYANSAQASTQSTTGVIIPLYSYPGSSWNAIIQGRIAHPNVPIVAIVNPGDGPGSSANPTYQTWIAKLQAAGVTVVGYVYTSYAARSIASIETDMSHYKAWYGVNGIFFDEMSNILGEQTYYSTLNTYADSLGYSLTVGNPGAHVPAAFIGSVDLIVIYESPGAPSTANLATASMGLSKSNFAFIAYDTGLSSSYVTSAAAYVSYMYLTDGGMPAPYGALSSYYSSLVGDLSAIPTTVPITVQSIGANGLPLAGMWTVISSGGNVVASGFTPMTFQGNLGQHYSVRVSNYMSYYFSHWGNGSTSSTTSLTVNVPTTLVAYYASVQQHSITVQSVTTSGATLNGMYTVVRSNGNIVATGFTPLVFYGTQGSQYTVTVANYKSDVFSHWTSLSTNPTITVTLSQDVSLTAVYST
jgi:hypothetical protein